MRTAFVCLVPVFLSTALCGAPVPPAKPSNLLVNGSFEEGPAVEKWLALNPGNKEIKGWVVTRGQIDLVSTHWPAADGKRSIDLHGSPGLGGVSQTFKTKPGQRYEVTFSLAGNPEGTVPKKVLGVSAAGETTSFTFDTTEKTRQNLGWVKKTWRFKAEKAQTTLELYTLMKTDTSCGPAIDNVSVMEVR